MKQIGKRVRYLKRVKKEMRRRFMLLYRLFRHKKYKEPLPGRYDDQLLEEDQ